MSKKIGVYIHIPFCVKKCNYCDFNSGAYSDEIKAEYVDALCKEIEIKSADFKDYIVDTVFMGGGTPSILPVEMTGKIFETLRSFYNVSEDAEITIETNPGTLEISKLKAYKGFGINRISMGLQSADNEQLKALGRIHTYEEFVENFNNAREAGFDNINVDLMSAIPGQDIESFKDTLIKVKNLEPEHISIYSLIIEEGTYFYNMKLNLPDEDEEREMVHCIPEILGNEYHQYEISNYSKPGFECKHNIKYWVRDEYIGFGVSAASLVGNRRIKITDDIKKYAEFYRKYNEIDKFLDEKEILSEDEVLSSKDERSEFIILGTRMNKGISINRYKSLFGHSIFDDYDSELNKNISEGLIVVDEGFLKLTSKGRDLANYVWMNFV